MKLVDSTVNSILYGKLKHISRFSVVGVINTLIDFIVFTTSCGLLGMNYTASQVLGYSFGVANSFILNKKWTFEDTNSHKKTLQEIVQFLVVNLVSLAVTVLAINFLVKSMGLNIYAAKVVVTVIAQAINFIGYKLWIFV